MQKKELPIGVYDSGAGGISVLAQARICLPHENFIYYGDSANAPYGTKSEEEIRDLSLACGDFLCRQGVKMIIIACNTATSITVQAMREKYNIPIISIEPAVKPAVEKYPEGKIAVLATPATLHQKRYLHLLDKLGAMDQAVNISCDGLAEIVERGNLSDPHIKAYLCEKFLPYRRCDFNGIVVGCTHYSFISDQIRDVARKICGGPCEIFDGMYGTARHVADVLALEGLLNDSFSEGRIKFFSSGEAHHIDVFERFLKIFKK
ncbi:glutamate racemase [Christensenella tenuis]|jgi:glutamate racemase|uniref:Glutamate racemase n=1 Tax=Christensenella tenuis TaxID=2763033 RepID=A0ABR7EBZ7_9FIRM|nr:glutamate racemase [Christensenella tenuis]MBC5647266.1 glutamate racemase [Christensenella tenuis]